MTLTLRARLVIASSLSFGVLFAGFGIASHQWFVPSIELQAMSHDDETMRAIDTSRRLDLNHLNPGRFDSGRFSPIRFNPIRFEATRLDPIRVRLTTQVMRSRDRPPTLPSVEHALRDYRARLWWRALPAALVALAVSWWLCGIALAPLAIAAAAARTIDVAHIDRRLPVRPVDDELTAVSTAFNDTLSRLEASIGEMRQFGTALAHELRTPLTVLRGEVERSLRRAHLDDAERDRVATQLDEIDRLIQLINQLLTLARAESGHTPLSPAPLDLHPLATSIVDQLEPVAAARQIALTIVSATPAQPDRRCRAAALTATPIVVEGDEGWIKRLLLNLIDNALKFTAPGGRVQVRLFADAERARIDICDTGVGMSPDVLRQLFTRFFRAPSAQSAGVPGAGLGLCLVKWIVERHRGAITFDSRPGRGTRCTVTLPMASGGIPRGPERT